MIHKSGDLTLDKNHFKPNLPRAEKYGDVL